MALYDGSDEDTRRQQREQAGQYDPNEPIVPITPGAQFPFTSPQPNWNGGFDPEAGNPYHQYNGGSPVDAPLQAGYGWEWSGPQQTQFNGDTGNWERGAWNQVAGRGIGYTAAPNAAPSGPAPQQPAFQPQAAAPAPRSGGGGGGAPSAPPASYQTPPITDEVTKMLLARLNELKSPQDLKGDPNYQNAVRAYQVASLRGADKQRKALAERSAAGGTRATGGFNVGVRGIAERQGENAAQYTSGLALDRLQQREAQLMEAIRIARTIGQDDIANQLEVQRLNLQQELGRGDLALRGELGRGQLQLGQDNLGLGYDQLGFSYADLVTRANRDATLAALG